MKPGPSIFRSDERSDKGYDAGVPVLNSKQRQFLKRLAHPLSPLVRVGKAGLTPAVVEETSHALKHHELIKVRIEVEDRGQRREVMGQLVADSRAVLVGSVGKVAVLYRAREDDPGIHLPA
jgi:RNA-binding protein